MVLTPACEHQPPGILAEVLCDGPHSTLSAAPGMQDDLTREQQSLLLLSLSLLPALQWACHFPWLFLWLQRVTDSQWLSSKSTRRTHFLYKVGIISSIFSPANILIFF